MSWQERDDAEDGHQRLGRPGGDWRGLRPTIDNPITWAISLFRVAGITVRIHLFFVVFIIIMLVRAASRPGTDVNLPAFSIVAMSMGILFLVVLLHEFGHCIACRMWKGDADEILMWPLGGLAYCRPAHDWRAHMATVIGGPAVNVVICVLAGIALYLRTGTVWEVAIPNPLEPFAALWHLQISNSWLGQALFLFHGTSFVLLLFNLLPIFPLDGGRMVQAALWPRVGYSRSMMYSVRAGYVGAVALFIFGGVTYDMWIVGIALFGGITCYITQKQVQWTDAMMGFESDEFALSLHQGSDADDEPGGEQAKPSRKMEKQARREQEEAVEVDRILQKIATSGLDSLSRSERGLLKRVTERKRQQET